MSVFKRDRDPYHGTQVQSPARQTIIPPTTPIIRDSSETPGASNTPPEPEVPQRASPVLQRDTAAVIDKNSQLTGTLHSNGNVLIEGAFKGEIEAKETVLVERNARTEAKLRANDVIVSGTFDGEIDCQHRLQITATATIKGEIKTPILIIEEGSTVDCCFKMTRAGR